MSGTQKTSKKPHVLVFTFASNVIHKATALRVLLEHLETNLPIKPRRLIFPMRKSNFILEANPRPGDGAAACAYAGWEHERSTGRGDGVATAAPV